MASNNYQLILTVEKCEPKTGPLQRSFCLRKRRPAYLVGEDFEVTYTIKNIGNEAFPGDKDLFVSINWPNQQIENKPYKIERLEPEAEQILGPSRWGVLSNGVALFRAGIILSSGIHFSGSSGHTREAFNYAKLYKDAENEILPDVSFYSIFGQQADEFYQLWAVWLAMIALWFPVSEKLKGLNFTIGLIIILFGVWLFNTLAIPRLKEIKVG